MHVKPGLPALQLLLTPTAETSCSSEEPYLCPVCMLSLTSSTCIHTACRGALLLLQCPTLTLAHPNLHSLSMTRQPTQQQQLQLQRWQQQQSLPLASAPVLILVQAH